MRPDSVREPFESRRERLGSLMRQRGLSLVVITNPINIFYLTGFRGSVGAAIFGPSVAILWVDPRYTLQAQEQALGVEVIESRGELVKAAGLWLGKKKPSCVGYEDSFLTCRQLRLLESEIGRRACLKPAGDLIEDLRAIKDFEEISLIRRAGHLTCDVFAEVLPLAQPGVRETDLAAEIEYRMRRKGAERAAFETIVASGHRAAFPHARASDKALEKGELVILDLGAILAGYAADMTRTLYLGQPPPQIRRFYKAVRDAQQEAVEALRAGARASDVDRAARRVLEHRGLAKYFTHSTGHGVGLEIHERPRLAKGEKARLEIGCVVTAEPGIYLKGLGGIRVEDTVLVGAKGPEVLTPAPKERWFIT